VTGWQGNDQGGWNQQPGPYGPDPYQQYPNDPYNQGADYGFGPDPYATPQFQTGSFPAYEQPRKRSKAPMVISLIAIVLIVGAVVTIVLLNRKPDATPAAGDDKSSSSAKPKDPTSEQPPAKDGWQLIDNTSGSGLVYEVPEDWKPSKEKPDSGLGVPFSGLAEYGTFDCEGSSFTRSFAASASVQGKEGAELDLAKTVQDFGTAFAKTAFDEGAQITPGQPTETTVGDAKALVLTSKVVPQQTKPNCQATESEVGVVGVVLEKDGKPAAVALLIVVNDLTGGPADPPPLAASVTQEILASVRLG
jgi:hypothetical protein